ncbi:MAG: CCA tRNA nucleotidyltransferase, partial [Candidatus Bathyarchaeia archaeon]
KSQVELEVLEKVTPKPEERAAVEETAQKTVNLLKTEVNRSSPDLEVRLDGSVAKDTWISGEADVDIFLQVPPGKPRSYLEVECLNLIRRALSGYKMLERYADHPYIEAWVNGVRVNVVPCYKAQPGQWLSATDRTPYHTEYMKARLNEELKGEVRLLKKLVKAAGIYGAEVKVKGFSGFLCELLTLKYGSFKSVLEAASDWRSPQLIDLEGWYRGRERDAFTLFHEPLIVVDPVDRARNAASAVSEENMWSLVQVARCYLARPDLKYFYPQPRAGDHKELRERLSNRESGLLILDLGFVDAVVDVLWSQLFKAEKAVLTLLKSHDFKPLRSQPISLEDGRSFIILELEKKVLSPIKKHVGPPVAMRNSTDRFLKKHLNASSTAAGPWIEKDRWCVLKKRVYLDAAQLLESKLEGGGVELGVPSKISESLRKGFKVMGVEEALKRYGRSGEFLQALYGFLEGRPEWLG